MKKIEKFIRINPISDEIIMTKENFLMLYKDEYWYIVGKKYLGEYPYYLITNDLTSRVVYPIYFDSLVYHFLIETDSILNHKEFLKNFFS